MGNTISLCHLRVRSSDFMTCVGRPLDAFQQQVAYLDVNVTLTFCLLHGE